jgi:DNA-binding FadR family transcriptional regulator
MTGLFLPVAKNRLYQHVAKQIMDLVIDGRLRAGDRLPPEAELCDQFGVSRTVIREATRCLVERGLLSSEPGRGTFVTAMKPQDLSRSIGLYFKSSEVSTRNLIEVRDLLEVKIAELAAERAQPEHLAAMERAFEEMEKSIESIEDFIDADLSFHMALAEATGNDIFLALIGSLVDGLQHVRREAAKASAGYRLSQRYHRAILESVRAGDKQKAADAMRLHLEVVARHFEQAQSKDPE